MFFELNVLFREIYKKAVVLSFVFSLGSKRGSTVFFSRAQTCCEPKGRQQRPKMIPLRKNSDSPNFLYHYLLYFSIKPFGAVAYSPPPTDLPYCVLHSPRRPDLPYCVLHSRLYCTRSGPGVEGHRIKGSTHHRRPTNPMASMLHSPANS